MKSALVFVLLIVSPIWLFAQKDPMKFGKISQEEVDLQYFEKDSSAVAVVLADYGHAYINLSIGKLIFERHTRIKILKKERSEEHTSELHSRENLVCRLLLEK